MRTLYATMLALAILPCQLLAAEESEEEFDPRRPPDTKLVVTELKRVKKAWKKASPEEKLQLLTSLELLDHPKTPPAIVALVAKEDVAVCEHALAVLREQREAFVAPAIPRLLEKRAADQALWLAILELGVEKKSVELLPHLRKIAEKTIPATGDAERDHAARRRTRSIEALGRLPHEASMETLVSIMESYAPLEAEKVEHGFAGSDAAYPRFYVPARLSFIQITGAQIESAAQARRWLTKNPEFTVEQAPREGADYLRDAGKKRRQ